MCDNSYKDHLSVSKSRSCIKVIACSLNADSYQLFCLLLKIQETLLRKLEENVESEMDNWQKIVERTQRELKEVEQNLTEQVSLLSFFTLQRVKGKIHMA